MSYNLGKPWSHVLNEISPSQKGKYFMTPLTRSMESSGTHRSRTECWGWSGGEGGVGNCCFNGHGVSVTQNESHPEICYTTMCIKLAILYCTLKNLLTGYGSRHLIFIQFLARAHTHTHTHTHKKSGVLASSQCGVTIPAASFLSFFFSTF